MNFKSKAVLMAVFGAALMSTGCSRYVDIAAPEAQPPEEEASRVFRQNGFDVVGTLTVTTDPNGIYETCHTLSKEDNGITYTGCVTHYDANVGGPRISSLQPLEQPVVVIR